MGFPRKGCVPSCWQIREQAGRGRGRHRDIEMGPKTERYKTDTERERYGEIQRHRETQRHREIQRHREMQRHRETQRWGQRHRDTGQTQRGRDMEGHRDTTAGREDGSSVCKVRGFAPGSVHEEVGL